MRFSVTAGRLTFHFIRRPVSDPPADRTVCFVDDGGESGWRNGQTAALYRDGEWTNDKGRPLRFAPTFWTTFDSVKGD